MWNGVHFIKLILKVSNSDLSNGIGGKQTLVIAYYNKFKTYESIKET